MAVGSPEISGSGKRIFEFNAGREDFGSDLRCESARGGSVLLESLATD